MIYRFFWNMIGLAVLIAGAVMIAWLLITWVTSGGVLNLAFAQVTGQIQKDQKSLPGFGLK